MIEESQSVNFKKQNHNHGKKQQIRNVKNTHPVITCSGRMALYRCVNAVENYIRKRLAT